MTEQSLNRLQRAFLDRAARSYNPSGKGRGASGDLKEAKIWQQAADLVQEEKRRVFGVPRVEEPKAVPA